MKSVTRDKKETILQVLRDMEDQFQNHGIRSSRLDAAVLIGHCCKRDRNEIYRDGDHVITNDERRALKSAMARRVRGEPVAYIVGTKEFWSLEFEVNKSVLIPRPETEILVEKVLDLFRCRGWIASKILEIGTGSGAISVALGTELEGVKIYATDISKNAIKVARRNALRHGVETHVFFVCCNLIEPISGTFDIIVSNPPYISEEEYTSLSHEITKYEPREALVAGPAGTEFHRDIIRKGGSYLRKGGWLFMEIGYGQKGVTESMLRETQKYDYIGFRRDYAGIERVVMAQRKG